MDAVAFEHFGGADSFPGRGNLDQHALALDAGRFVQRDQFAALGDVRFGVERQAGVDLGGDAARDDVQDFDAKSDQHAVDDVGGRKVRTVAHGLLEQRAVFGLLQRF